MADKPVSLTETRLMDVKVRQLPYWLAAHDFTPNGIIGEIRRGHNRYFTK
ncbi:ATP synthase subunit f, mitochondrial-like [Bombina bombina]|nr:ATP synthase subunit f, mitochondrial-like [Bombina bombina]